MLNLSHVTGTPTTTRPRGVGSLGAYQLSPLVSARTTSTKSTARLRGLQKAARRYDGRAQVHPCGQVRGARETKYALSPPSQTGAGEAPRSGRSTRAPCDQERGARASERAQKESIRWLPTDCDTSVPYPYSFQHTLTVTHSCCVPCRVRSRDTTSLKAPR